jgi:hypothetical protein
LLEWAIRSIAGRGRNKGGTEREREEEQKINMVMWFVEGGLE